MTWTAWENLGSNLPGAPALASRLPNQIDIFRATPEQVLHANDSWVAGPNWDTLQWNDLGKPHVSASIGDIAAAQQGARSLVVVVNIGGYLRYRHHDGHQWTGWQEIPGETLGRPAVAISQTDHIDVAVWGRDTGYHLRTRLPSGTWTDWSRIGEGEFTGPPSMVRTANGVLDIVGVGNDGAVWANHFQSGWHGWTPLGGGLPSDGDAPLHSKLAMSSRGLGQYEVFYTRDTVSDHRVTWGYMRDGIWSGWEPHPSVTHWPPFAISTTEGELDLYHYGTDALYRRRWTQD